MHEETSPHLLLKAQNQRLSVEQEKKSNDKDRNQRKWWEEGVCGGGGGRNYAKWLNRRMSDFCLENGAVCEPFYCSSQRLCTGHWIDVVHNSPFYKLFSSWVLPYRQ